MTEWAEDPEIVATFAAEVAERVSSLSAGLLQLEGARSLRQVTDGLLRDSHAVKGAARLLQQQHVVRLAHRMEDVFAAILDARVEVRRDVVDLLLMSATAIGLGVQQPDDPTTVRQLETLADCLDSMLRMPGVAPVMPSVPAPTRRNRLIDGVIRLSMVPIGRVLAGLPRLVQDVSEQSGKSVRLLLDGADMTVDARTLEVFARALPQLVVNAVDHGCELPKERERLGKPAVATIHVRAWATEREVVVEVVDDGRGIDVAAVRRQGLARGRGGMPLAELLTTPGLTTAQRVSETSGRGVGLDVVRTALHEVGGRLDVTSTRGAGTVFVLTVPAGVPAMSAAAG